MTWKKWAKAALGVVFAAGCVLLCLRDIDPEDILGAMSRLRWGWLLAAVLNTLVTVFLLGWRWRIVLQDRTLSLWLLFKLNNVSQFLNILLPARLGDVVRAYVSSRKLGLPGAYMMGTVVIEKTFDLASLLALWAVSAFWLPVGAGWKKINVFAPLAAFVFILAVVSQRRRLAGFLLRKNSLLPSRYRERLTGWIKQGAESFSFFLRHSHVFLVAAISAASVLLQAWTNGMLFSSLDIDLSLGAAMAVLMALQVVTIPPSTPGRLGVFEYAVVTALSLYCVPQSQALGYAIVLHAVSYVPKIVLGVWYSYRLNLKIPGGPSRSTEPPHVLHL